MYLKCTKGDHVLHHTIKSELTALVHFHHSFIKCSAVSILRVPVFRGFVSSKPMHCSQGSYMLGTAFS